MVSVGTSPSVQGFADPTTRDLSVPGDDCDTVSRPVVGTLDEIQAVFHTRVVDEVAVCLPATAANHADLISRLASDEGKTVRISLDPTEDRLPSSTHEEFDGFLVRSLVRDDQHVAGLVVNRFIDIAGAGVGLVILSPSSSARRSSSAFDKER